MRGVAVVCAAAAVYLVVVPVPVVRPGTWQRPRAGVILWALTSGLVGFVVAMALLGTPIPAMALGALVSIIPVNVLANRARRRCEDHASAWPDLLAHVRSSVAAGRTLPDAYLEAAERVGGPFGPTLDAVRTELLYGAGFASAMELVRIDADDPTADRVVATLVVASESGGTRVGSVLAALSASVAGESRVRRAHEAALTEQRWTAGVALAAPWVILALSIATNPQAAAAFDSAQGSVVVAIGLVATIGGWALARRSAALSRTPRMFR